MLLLDTNVVSILFKPEHPLHGRCYRLVAGRQWYVAFMTRAELLFWPRANSWGLRRREELLKHIELCTTLFPDEDTCVHWADIMAESQQQGLPMDAADAWIAATARQWNLPLVTNDLRDFQHVAGLNLMPI